MTRYSKGLMVPNVLMFDIIVQGRTYEEALERLVRVFERLRKYNLRLMNDKCTFFKKSIKFLSHVIDDLDLRKSRDKVEALQKTPSPKNVTQLRTFLGLANYYNRFIPH